MGHIKIAPTSTCGLLVLIFFFSSYPSIPLSLEIVCVHEKIVFVIIVFLALVTDTVHLQVVMSQYFATAQAKFDLFIPLKRSHLELLLSFCY
jgi:hypothetical protein